MYTKKHKQVTKKRPNPFAAAITSRTGKRDSVTENNAVAHSSAGSKCLDFFSTMAASRKWDKQKQIDTFKAAWAENQEVALKLLFWLRDVRSGAGERQTFKNIYEWMMSKKTNTDYTKAIRNNLRYLPEFGRWDDLWNNNAYVSERTFKVVIDIIKRGLSTEDALLGKWLPREKSNPKQARIFASELGMTMKEYRQTCSKLASTVEQLMSDKRFNDINYSHVPSLTMNKYRTSFYKQDEDRFNSYINKAVKGKVKINSNVITPGELYKSSKRHGSINKTILAQWNQLPNYVGEESIFPVIDRSGSMNGDPIIHATALGIYLAERNKGKFNKLFCTFSNQPRFVQGEGDVFNMWKQAEKTTSGFNTNIVAVFDKMLNLCIENNVKPKHMPTKIAILSDMQWDGGKGVFNSQLQAESWKKYQTNFENIKRMYKKAGYKKPSIIFWNLKAVSDTQPIRHNSNGDAMVSGYSTNILKTCLQGKIINPMDTMNKALERYSMIKL